MSSSLPSVTIVIPSWNGAQHLPACLESLRALDYPEDRFEVLVVENGSTDGSRDLLRTDHPWVRVLEQDANLGFARGTNVGAEASSAECLAFLNNDMRVDRAWLRELVGLYDPEAGDACVASVILDWEGRHVDFVDAFVNFHGAAGHLHYGEPIDTVPLEDGRELPFACGGAMLVDRRAFLRVGGFDPAFFALVEDVDLGWRLWLSGYRIRLAARARCFHRHSATTSQLGDAYRQFLSERNALRMLIKNVEDEHFAPLLTAALLLLVQRVDLESGIDQEALRGGGGELTAPSSALARVHAVAEVVRDLDSALEERARVQRLRRRGDDEVFALFRQPFVAVRGEEDYLEAAARLPELLGLEALLCAADSAAGRPPVSGERTTAVDQLLAKWRLEYGVGKPAWWHVRRAVLNRLPEALRSRIRAAAGRT